MSIFADFVEVFGARLCHCRSIFSSVVVFRASFRFSSVGRVDILHFHLGLTYVRETLGFS